MAFARHHRHAARALIRTVRADLAKWERKLAPDTPQAADLIAKARAHLDSAAAILDAPPGSPAPPSPRGH